MCKVHLVLAYITMASIANGSDDFKYPATRTVDQVDTFHGVKVPDPYRWLEADVRESDEVAAWVKAQNEITRAYLDAIPERKEIEQRLTKIWNFERFSVPMHTAGKYFYMKNNGLQNQSVLYVADDFKSAGRVLIDPNAWSEDGTVSLGSLDESDDAKYLAYGRQEAGSDWSTIHVMEVESGKLLDDVLKWVRWGNVVWNAEGTGFYYIRYPEPQEGEQHQALAVDPAIYYHKLGDAQAEDVLVYKRPDQPKWSFWLSRTDDNKFLVLSISRSTDPQNQVLYRKVDAPLDGEFTTLIGDFDNEFSCLGNIEDKLYFVTDHEAPTKRIVTMDVNQPGREALGEIVPASEATLETASLLKDKIVVNYLKDVVSQVKTFDLAGKSPSEVTLPGIGAAAGFGGRQTDTETFFSFTSYTMPASIYRLDLADNATKVVRQPKVAFDSDDYGSQLRFYKSKDGTRVPIIVSYRKGLKLDGKNPTLLYAYGGFNISITPAFSPAMATWMEMGGVLAVPNLRGGGEYGEDWHLAGKKLNKQNVFDDFIAAAEWLIAEKYTLTPKLAIMGGSNGGLLVGAVLTQRPDLFGACLPEVGVLDMLRYQNFTAGHFWRDEYGTVDDAAEFKALLAYSPYHNVKPGTKFPPTLVITADTDDRVVPMHSFKFGAALQAAQAGDAPILLRIETRAGHGAATPTTKRIEKAADLWAFLWKNLGMGG